MTRENTVNPSDIEKLAREYRPSMDKDTVHDWAVDAANMLKRLSAAPLHEGEGEPVAWVWDEWSSLVGDWRARLTFDKPDASSRFRRLEPLYAAPPPSAPRMLVDQSWLDRRVENEPDGLDCEVVPASVEVERLREEFAALLDLFAREDENSVERFDRLAEMFDRDTGYMAPGKSRPMHRCDQPDGPELHRIYDAWFAGRVERARAALSRKQEPGVPTPGEWIEWSGGENPVPGKVVGYRCKSGESYVFHSETIRWAHQDASDDIIAYRIVPTPGGQSPANQEQGQSE